MIDTHSHIYLDRFREDRREMLIRAREAGVEKIFLPNIDRSSIADLKQLAIEEEHCLPMMGLHPGSVKENWQEELRAIEEELFSQAEWYRAVGEIGIDLYWDKTHIEAQKTVFQEQLKWAERLQLPVVIHCREAFAEVFEGLEAGGRKSVRGIFHCFTGSAEDARRAICLGLKLGLGGVVTYRNSGLAEVVEDIDLQHIVLETDAPYLAPVPFRSKRNEPAYLRHIAEKIAEIKNCSLEEVDRITTQNAREVFAL